jgi:hypothetical protein
MAAVFISYRTDDSAPLKAPRLSGTPTYLKAVKR